MKKYLFLFIIIFVPIVNYAQNFDCSSNLKWLIETFEKNDAGFQYVIDKKGENAYLNHNKIFKEKASKITDRKKCLKLLNDWTEFFRKHHLQVVFNSSRAASPKKKLTEKEIKRLFKNTGKYHINKKDFKNYINHLKTKNGFEGIWADVNPYTIGIIRDTKNTAKEFTGFIIDSESPYWQKNQIKLEIYKNEDDTYKMKYYLDDRSYKIFKNIDITGNNYLITSSFALKRLEPVLKKNKYAEVFIRSIYIHRPFIEKISNNTLLFRISSFARSQKKEIERLLTRNDSLLRKTPNLIIDLRDNYGGDSASFENLIPYLYTNPIRTFVSQYLSTELNNKRMIDFINNPNWTDKEKEWAKKSFEKLNKDLGEFVNLEEKKVRVEKFDSILPYPKQVAILINNRCASATESFLLKAKQSKKVKLMGTTTAGILDISNLYRVNSPDGIFTLWYSLTKSYRIDEMPIDEIGIQPDFYFDKSIKYYDWVKEAEKILNYK